jgi:hypothetical protein
VHLSEVCKCHTEFKDCSISANIDKTKSVHVVKSRLYVTVPNPNVPNAKVPNVTVLNLNMSTRHGAECTTEPNCNVPKCQGVDVIKCRMYHIATLQWTEPTNCRIVELPITNPTLLEIKSLALYNINILTFRHCDVFSEFGTLSFGNLAFGTLGFVSLT